MDVEREAGKFRKREQAETKEGQDFFGDLYEIRKEDTRFFPGEIVSYIIISSQCCSNSCRVAPHSSLG